MARTVLIADADRGGMTLLAHRLREAGYEVAIAGNCDEALARAPQADVVCLDVGLPGGGGFALYPRLKALKPVPIVLMLERIDDATSAGIAATGAEDLLFKPLDAIEVIDKLAWYLEPDGEQV